MARQKKEDGKKRPPKKSTTAKKGGGTPAGEFNPLNLGNRRRCLAGCGTTHLCRG